jgi:hypothetical protein
MELYRLFRQAGDSPWAAAWFVFVAWSTGSVAEAKHATMEHLLGNK